MNRILNRKIVVIGGTSGIGLATARQLASEGAHVTVAGRSSDRGKQAAEEAPELEVQLLDASSPEAVTAFFERYRSVDDLVLTIGGAKGAGPFSKLDLSSLLAGFEEKLFTQIRCAQLALPSLSKDASITFVSAITARAANPGTSGLAAINGAIESMIKPLAKELQPLRINAVSPGVVETTWWDNVPESVRTEMFKQSSESSLVKRNGQPEDIADAIVLLIRNSFMTGTVIEVDGGLHLN